MNRFELTRADSVADALARIAGNEHARFIAGGTNLLDLMKEDVSRPRLLIDISHLPLSKIEDGGKNAFDGDCKVATDGRIRIVFSPDRLIDEGEIPVR